MSRSTSKGGVNKKFTSIFFLVAAIALFWRIGQRRKPNLRISTKCLHPSQTFSHRKVLPRMVSKSFQTRLQLMKLRTVKMVWPWCISTLNCCRRWKFSTMNFPTLKFPTIHFQRLIFSTLKIFNVEFFNADFFNVESFRRWFFQRWIFFAPAKHFSGPEKSRGVDFLRQM